MRKIAFFILSLWIATFAQAKVKPASPFNDGMVLQQQTKVKIWGWSQPNKAITISGTWNKQKVRTTANNQGQWEAYLQTPKGSFTPYEVNISDGEKLTIKNVLIGEVWLGSGQSNMEMPLEGWAQCPVEHSQELIAQAQSLKGKLRLAQINKKASNTPIDSCTVKWEECTPTTASKFSAVAYVFGQELCKALNCPVGIINSSSSSTRVEAWLPLDAVKNYPDMAPLLNNLEDYIPSMRPSCSFNAMIHPLIGYNLRGFIWYQGEANVALHHQYTKRFEDLITSWRTLWKQTDLPFYFVEIAPYIYKGNSAGKAPLLRQAQLQVSRETANTAMVSTTDLVSETEKNQIHPSKKQEIGIRLAAQALSKTYALNVPYAQYPELEKAEIEKRKVVITIKNAPQGFTSSTPINGFEMCGNNQQFYHATAEIVNNQIILTCSKVRQPLIVRYSFQDFPNGNVKNKQGLPLIPFQHQF